MSTREESNEDWELGLNLSDQKEVRTQGYEGTWVFSRFSGVLRSFVSACDLRRVRSTEHLTGQGRSVF